METFTIKKILLFISVVTVLSCEKETNHPETDINDINTAFIVGDTSIVNYFTISPSIILSMKCFEQFVHYSCIDTLDYNSDGVNEFGIRFSGYSDEFSSQTENYYQNEFINFLEYEFVCNEKSELKKLNLTDTLHSNLNWIGSHNYLLVFSSPYEYKGEWLGLPMDGFVGFRKFTESDTIMGWLKMKRFIGGYEICSYGLNK